MLHNIYFVVLKSFMFQIYSMFTQLVENIDENKICIKTKLMLPEDFGFILSNDFTDGKVQNITYENIKNSLANICFKW